MTAEELDELLREAERERDEARLDAVRIAENLVETTGKLVLAEAERDRLREERDAALTTCDKRGRQLDTALGRLRVTDEFRAGQIDRISELEQEIVGFTGKVVVLRDFVAWAEALQCGRELSPESIDRLVARARRALEPKEVARVALSTEGAD